MGCSDLPVSGGWLVIVVVPLIVHQPSFNCNSKVNVSLLHSFSSLFPDVVNCMQTDNLELKKLVYLYLMNYAKSQPDMAIMAVNTFVKVEKF